MKFHYVAAQSDGKIIEGELEAKNTAEVLVALTSKGLKPLSLKKEADSSKIKARLGFGGSINIYDKIFLVKYLALMLKTGSDLFKAIDVLIADFTKQSMRSFLFEIKENLEKGQPFYVAFSQRPKFFSLVFVNLIKAGEASGTLEKTFERLTDTLQKEQELKQQIKSALVYPALLVAGATAVIFFIITFSLPKIASLFQDSGFKPPIFSQIVFAIGGFLNNYFFFIFGAAIVLALLFWILMSRNSKFKDFFSYFVRRLPLLGKLLKIISLQRFAHTFASLIASGIGILEALEITSQVAGDPEMKSALLRIARGGVAKGLTIGEAFKKEPVFPSTVSNLVAISEKSGNLSNILFTLSEFYESEIKTSIKILISLLEPILLAIIGVSIGIIALAVLVPIYQLIGSF